MNDKKKIGTAASVAVAGLALAAGAAGALTANADTPSATPSASASASAGTQQGPQGGHGQHTAATAAETASVKAAIKAKDSAVTVTSVEKDADGSFDAQGTKNGQPVHVEVSKDLKTVTVQTGGFGGHGGQQGTAASASETTSVKDAVKAKDSSVTVENVMKESDGSFHAFGTKGSTRVRIDVSKDLKTVTITTDTGKGQRGTQATAAETTSVKAAVKAKDSSVTVQGVMKDSDGSFHAFGTKGSTRVRIEVSKDLKTVTITTDNGPQGGQQGQAPSGTPSAAPSASASQPA